MTKPSFTCFLVSPFGNKELSKSGGIGNFELIRACLKEVIESYPDADIKLKRADEIVDVGSVAKSFILALNSADIVVADLTQVTNANVYYELGIRHALRNRITIPIWQKGTDLPADVRGLLGVEYEPTNPKQDLDSFHRFIRQRLLATLTDSPVHDIIRDIEVVSAAAVELLRSRVRDLEQEIAQSTMTEAVAAIWDEARRLLSKGDPGAALKKLRIAYQAAPKHIKLALDYGQLLSKQKYHEEAVGVLTSLVDRVGASEGPCGTFFRELGLAYSRWGKNRLALDWLEKSIACDPDDADTLGIVGGVYKQELDLAKSIDAYERGFNVDSRSTYCLLNVIALLLVRNQPGDKIKLKRMSNAANKLTKAAADLPGADHWALFDRAHFELFYSHTQESLATFSSAILRTNTVGELESAQKNLLLLKEAGTALDGLDSVLARFEQRQKTLAGN